MRPQPPKVRSWIRHTKVHTPKPLRKPKYKTDLYEGLRCHMCGNPYPLIENELSGYYDTNGDWICDECCNKR